MADVANESDEERRQRLHQEEMERLLMDQEEQEPTADHGPDNLDNINNNENQGFNIMGNNNDINNNDMGDMNHPVAGVGGSARFQIRLPKLTYTHSSFLAAAATIAYALRTRGQWYLALVYLSSSKWAFCILGNAMVALAVQVFTYTTHVFLQGGLRLHEAEGLQDFFRWNVTETCLALTMFRSELSVGTALEFLCLVVAKCLHHVAVLRQTHLRMTDDAIQPASWDPRIPVIPAHHLRILLLLLVLQCLDLCALHYTAQLLMDAGPSVSILFAFEAAILLASAWSHLLLWHLHVMDGLLHFVHDHAAGGTSSSLSRTWLHIWKEHKATLTFAVELQAQAVQFLFYLSFFGFVLTYYGVPINLFREVYLSFAALKERMVAFFKYRRLMANMNSFSNPTEEELDQAGRVCIICRDEMTVLDCKKLPICQHIFHKSCLREWLTQQQTCPTCRSDIVANQAQEATRNAAAAQAQQRQEQEGQQQQQQDTVDQSDTNNEAPAREVGPGTESSSTKPKDPPDTNGHLGTTTSSSSNSNNHCDEKNKSDKQPPTNATANKSDDSSWCDLLASSTDDGPSSSSPPISSSATPGKVVRFSSTLRQYHPHLGATTTTTLPDTAFPALYRVVKASGATVWHFDEPPPPDPAATAPNQLPQMPPPVILRTIPLSVAVLGLNEDIKVMEGPTIHHPPSMVKFIQIPNGGWISEDDVLRVYTIGG